MRKLFTILLLFACMESYTQCPIYGSGKSPKSRMSDSLKNRNMVGVVDTTVTLQNILTNLRDDSKSYSSSQYVRLTGYVILVKYGGPETRNCHSKNKEDFDIHIAIGLSPNSSPRMSMVVELTRFSRVDSNYTVNGLKNLIGKKVTVEGFLFFDESHKHNAITTNPKGTQLWRWTAVEVHPVMKIYLSN